MTTNYELLNMATAIAAATRTAPTLTPRQVVRMFAMNAAVFTAALERMSDNKVASGCTMADRCTVAAVLRQTAAENGSVIPAAVTDRDIALIHYDELERAGIKFTRLQRIDTQALQERYAMLEAAKAPAAVLEPAKAPDDASA